ncbi:MAG: helix-turn-helix transcriptional regulator [Bacteroidetes bacterium]|nr:helix-turn-helix transcriptional regulator [Bacteroidota bacterium]
MQTTDDLKCIRTLANPIQIQMCKGKLDEASRSLERLAQVLSLAGNEVRLKILYLLEEEGELCPCDLSDILGMSVPAVSQHLRKLKDASVVQIRKDGQTIFYSLKKEHLEIIRPLFGHISFQSESTVV